MRIIRNVRIPLTLLAAEGVRLQGSEQVDILTSGVVALVDRPKVSENLRMPSCSALVQDARSGYGVFLMGFNDMADEVASLKVGATVHYIGKAGTFKGREKFTAFQEVPFNLTIVDNTLSVPAEVPAPAQTETDQEVSDQVGAAFGLADSNVPW